MRVMPRATRRASRASLLVAGTLALWTRTASAQQELGHKTLGTLGLRAGSQADGGVYLTNRIVGYRATQVFDRNGNDVPVGLDVDALGSGLGVGVSVELPNSSVFLNASIGIPMARVSASTLRPEASVDRSGFGDLYLNPIGLGWKATYVDLVASYALYVPTGHFEPQGGGGIGRGNFTHQFSLGGTVYLDRQKTWHLSALASYDLNLKKRGIDITRGDTIQVQGGFGATFFRALDIGIAAYGLWQVDDDSGNDLPPVLRGARDRAYGIGPELGVALPPVRSKVTLRYERDSAVQSRPAGQIVVVGWTVLVWPPPSKRGE